MISFQHKTKIFLHTPIWHSPYAAGRFTVPFLVHKHYSSKVIHQLFQPKRQHSSTKIQYPANAKTPNFNTQISRKSLLLQVQIIQPVFQFRIRPETNLSLTIVDLAQHPIRTPTSIITNSTYYCVPYQPTNDHRPHNTSCMYILSLIHI